MKQDRLPSRAYHQLNFYIAIACFFGIFCAPDATLAGIFFVACIANLASAQGMANRDNLEYLNKKVEEKRDED